MVDPFLDWLATLPGFWVYTLLAALSAVENVFPPVPSDVALVLGAFLAHRGVTSPLLLGTLCWATNTATSAWVYYAARRRGAALFAQGWLSRALPPASRQAMHDAYVRHGVLGIFFCRLLPGVRVAVTPFAGVLQIPAVRVLVPSALATAVWYATLVVVGAVVGENWERARGFVEDANRTLAAIAAAGVTVLAVWLWRRARTAPPP